MLGYRGTTYPQKQTSRRCQEEFLTNGVETEITIEYKVSVEIKLPLNKHKKIHGEMDHSLEISY